MLNQKELKPIYKAELEKVWKDEKMVNYCMKETAFIIEHNGKIYDIEKPSIETNFCFGYGFYGNSSDEEQEEASKMVAKAENDKQYFLDRNLKSINQKIELLKEILKNAKAGNTGDYQLAICSKYIDQTEDYKLANFEIVDYATKISDKAEYCNDVELLEKLLAGYEEVKEKFTKRLFTYLKRYGLSKIKVWSYLRD